MTERDQDVMTDQLERILQVAILGESAVNERAGFPPGPWNAEPDSSEWVTAAGLKAYALRHTTLGCWCGYVEVPPGHPLFGVGYSEESAALSDSLARRKAQPIGENPSFAVLVACAIGGGVIASPTFVFMVHGGITFAGAGYWPGADKDSWWYGFDCGHCDDIQPGMLKYYSDSKGTYRDLAYVFAECESLAEQLAEVKVDDRPNG